MTAIFEIELPDGNILEIEAPENTPPDQIKARARQYMATQSKPQESAFALQQRAARGDSKALAEYNRRAAAAGQSSFEQERANNDPTIENDNFVSGVGSVFVDNAMGLKQLALQAGNKIGLVDDSTVADYQRKVDREAQLQAPLMNTGAGQAGVVAGNVALWANPVTVGPRAVTVPGKILGAAAGGYAIGGIQPTQTGESRLANAGEGALLAAGGQGVASGLGLLGRKIPRPDVEKRAAIRYGDSIGVRLSAGELSDNGMMRNVASQMERFPFSGGRARWESNAKAFTGAVAGELGLKSDKLTPRVFGKRMSEIGDKFNELSARSSLVLDKQLMDDLARVQSDSERLMGTGQITRNWIDELISKADESGVVPGESYKSFDSNIGKIMKSGGEKAFALGELRDAVRNNMDRFIKPEDAAEWAQIRKQYAVGKTIEPLVAKTKDGIIPPAQLMGRMTADKAGKTRMANNKAGELGKLARLGQYMKEAPDSASGDRALVNVGLLGGLFGAQNYGLIEPSTAMMIGGGLLANRYGLKAINKAANDGAQGVALGLSRRLGNASQRALPAAAMAGTAFAVSPQDFNQQLNSRIAAGEITRAQAATELDAYLQNYSAANGIDQTRQVYQQFPEWSAILDN